MNKGVITIIAIVIGVSTLIISIHANESRVKEKMTTEKRRIFLIGASVGKEWNLSEYPERMNSDSLNFESSAVYQYDKTDALEELLMRPKRKFHLTRTYLKGFFQPAARLPELIIIKECAAYFPGDMNLYKSLMKNWVRRVKESGIEVALATVVPVTKARADQDKGKIEAVREYNDWIREYARKENIKLLDLESALRTESEKRYLRDEYTSGDGLHLNKEAYKILDDLIKTDLEKKS